MRFGTLVFFLFFAAFIAATVYGYSYYIETMRNNGSALNGGGAQLRSQAKAQQSQLRTLARGRDPLNNGGNQGTKKAAQNAVDVIKQRQKKRQR